MGRIGRSYPHFEEAGKPSVEPAEAQGDFASQALGAMIGILSALGLIGWLMTR
jgi:hypothetical protein